MKHHEKLMKIAYLIKYFLEIPFPDRNVNKNNNKKVVNAIVLFTVKPKKTSNSTEHRQNNPSGSLHN